MEPAILYMAVHGWGWGGGGSNWYAMQSAPYFVHPNHVVHLIWHFVSHALISKMRGSTVKIEKKKSQKRIPIVS